MVTSGASSVFIETAALTAAAAIAAADAAPELAMRSRRDNLGSVSSNVEADNGEIGRTPWDRTILVGTKADAPETSKRMKVALGT